MSSVLAEAPATGALAGRDLLAVGDLDAAELVALLDLGDAVKAAPRLYAGALAGRTLAMIFEKPSTRTRVSFDVAMYGLGGHALALAAADLQLSRGETVGDTGLVLSRYVDALVIRTGAHARAAELAEAAAVPVVNGLTDLHHPCQALADLQTLRERLGPLAGRRLAWVGDGASNVFHSLAAGAAMLDMEVVCACPAGYEPSAGALAGAPVTVLRDAHAAVAGADAIVTDVFVSMGQEADRARRLADLAPYRVDAALLAGAAPGHVLLHCLPAHVGEEITEDVLHGPSSAVLDEAENRLHAQRALLLAILEGELP